MRFSAHTFIRAFIIVVLFVLVAAQTYGQTSKIPIVVANMMFGTDIYLYDTLSGTSEIVISDAHWNESPSLSPDNSKLVFSSNRSGAIDLYLIDLNTQDEIQITNDSAFEVSPAWDWTSERIVYKAERQLFVYYVATGVTENIAEGYTFFEPQWSPDGQKIAFTSYQSQNERARLYILDLSTEIVTPIAPPEIIAASPKWSPDGSMVAFWSGEQIYVWNAATGQIVQVTNTFEINAFAWLQDNTLLYRGIGVGDTSGGVYQIHPDGTNKQAVPFSLPSFPNLQSIELPNLLILPMPTLTLTPTYTPTSTFTPTPSNTPAPTPTPFAGGGYIVFECGFPQDEGICIADGFNTFFMEGSEPSIGGGNLVASAYKILSSGGIQVLDTDDYSNWNPVGGSGTYASPSLSADGTKIAYAYKPNGTNTKYVIRTININGTGEQTLTATSVNSRRPHWSPDGTKIVFYADNDGDNEIYTMNANGSNVVKLTNNTSSDIDPRWSPDGTQIVFSANRDGNQEIYKMNADGSSQTRLTNNAAADVELAWSPDGTQIVFVRGTAIYQMNTSGGQQTQITSGRNPDWGFIIPPPPGCEPGTCLVDPGDPPEE